MAELRAVTTNHIICLEENELLKKKVVYMSNMIEIEKEKVESVQSEATGNYFVGGGVGVVLTIILFLLF